MTMVEKVAKAISNTYGPQMHWENCVVMARAAIEVMKPQVEKAIADYDAVLDSIGSCGDGGCLVKRPVGQHTNGGCRCSSDRMKAQRVMLAARRLRAALSEEVER